VKKEPKPKPEKRKNWEKDGESKYREEKALDSKIERKEAGMSIIVTTAKTGPMDFNKFILRIISKMESERRCELQDNIHNLLDEDTKKTRVLDKRVTDNWKRIVSKVIMIRRVMKVWKSVKRDILLYGANTIKSQIESPLEYQSTVDKKPCLLYSGTRFKTCWNMLMVVLLLYTASFVPFKIAYLQPSTVITILDYVVDSLFAIDILINFFSPFHIKDKLITDRCKIAKNYMKGWFIFDIIVIFPFQLCLPGGGGGNQYNGLVRLMKLPRIYRVFRIVKLIKMVRTMGKTSRTVEKIIYSLIVNAGMLRLIQLLFTLVLFVHLFGCGWFLVAKLTDFGPDTWYNLNNSFKLHSK
jgi:hypothetical protein